MGLFLSAIDFHRTKNKTVLTRWWITTKTLSKYRCEHFKEAFRNSYLKGAPYMQNCTARKSIRITNNYLFEIPWTILSEVLSIAMTNDHSSSKQCSAQKQVLQL